MNETVAIVNPKSANGRTARAFEDLRPLLPSGIEILYTAARGHAAELTAAALKRGAGTIVALGGDGTIHEVVNGFFEGGNPIAPDARLAIVPCGTGSDFRRSTGVPSDPRAAVDLLRTGIARRIDALRVVFTTMDGATRGGYAVNVVSFGLGGAAVARANRMSKALGGKLSYAVASILAAARFNRPVVEMLIDNQPPIHGRITHVAIGNGQFHGGGMWVCPRAAIDDGCLDITSIGNLRLGKLVRFLPALYNGGIYNVPQTYPYSAQRLEAFSDETVLVELDGESAGKLPIEVTVMPGALNLIVPR